MNHDNHEPIAGKSGHQDLPPSRFDVVSWVTAADQSALFDRQQDSLPFTDAPADYPTIQVDNRQKYQTMEGFGFALTGGSASLISRLPPLSRSGLLRELFSSEDNGIGVSCLRLSIGASDLSEKSFSYDDRPAGETDEALSGFNMAAGDNDLIPLLKEIIAINPDIKIIATPWSAPPWMKTSNSYIGGKLRSDCHRVYANYLARYIRAMDENGIAIHAITPQNEPLNDANEPSMLMEADEQADFIKTHLGPVLKEAGLSGVEIFCWDHNCDRPDYPMAILADPDARSFISGVAWHLYGGDIAALSEVHEAYPEMKMYFTEQWVGRNGNFSDDLRWHMRNVMVGAARNWSRVVLEWNLASDPFCGPHTPGGAGDCVGALTVGAEIERNVSYYVIAHAAKFVRPGSKRIFSNALDCLPNVAFLTPDNMVVLIILNDARAGQTFNILFDGRVTTATLEEGSVGTYLWQL